MDLLIAAQREKRTGCSEGSSLARGSFQLIFLSRIIREMIGQFSGAMSSPTSWFRVEINKDVADRLFIQIKKSCVLRVSRNVHFRPFVKNKLYIRRKIVIAAQGWTKYAHKFFLSCFAKLLYQLGPNYWISCWSSWAKPTAFNWFELFRSNFFRNRSRGSENRVEKVRVVFRAWLLWGGILSR